MDEQRSPAEAAYVEALQLSVNTKGEDALIRRNACEKIIELYKRALALGLDIKDEIRARTFLAEILSEMIAHDKRADDLLETGINSVPYAAESVEQFEKALLLDSEHGSIVFGDPIIRLGALPKVELLWFSQGNYLSDNSGVESAISYLEGKVKLVEYLGGNQLPSVCNEIGVMYGQLTKPDLAAVWYERAIAADDFGDDFMIESKGFARDNLRNLSHANAAATKKGCFIATAVYGDAECFQVQAFKSFRDDVLARSLLGRHLITLYYRASPGIARFVAKRAKLRYFIRCAIMDPLYELVSALLRKDVSEKKERRP